MEYIVQTQELTKKYGQRAAADRVSMHIAKGDIYGFIGKNGAGKTTTMKMILGTCFPTSGSIELFGKPADEAARTRIGSLIEDPGLYRHCTAYENMRRFALLWGVDYKEIDPLLQLVQLADTGKKKVREFSLGMRQRLGIALAMLGNPELLVLDEPVNGLDPAAIKLVRDVILQINSERGVTVLISSHLLGELSKLATRYGIIHLGRLVDEVSADELEARCARTLDIRCRDIEIAQRTLAERFGITGCAVQGDLLRLRQWQAETDQINQALVEAGAGVCDLHVSAADMEDYFIERIGQ